MNLERQHDELLAMESIYDSGLFTSNHNQEKPEGMFHAQVEIQCQFHIIKHNCDGSKTNEVIKYLPPIILHFSFPENYPSKEPPWYILSCTWLSRSQLSRLCAELDRIWDENHSEVLFLWTEFLKCDSLSVLNIENILDVTSLCSYRTSKEMPGSKSANKQSATNSTCSRMRQPMQERGEGTYDQRAFLDLQFGTLLIPSLIEYNQHQMDSAFNSSLHDCGVCFEQKFGHQSIKFQGCNHVYCKACMAEYFKVKIQDGSVQSLTCPFEKCSSTALPNQIRDLVDTETFSKYDKLLLNSTLNTMNDIYYCPRLSCQCPVIADKETNLASCSSCSFAFCTYCKRAYHGVAPCSMDQAEIGKLRDIYLKGTQEEKLELEKRHGRRNIQKLIEESLSSDYVKVNSKQCPKCLCHIEKIDGCNKMLCWNCNSNFCWICNSLLDSRRPYLHFNNPDRGCFNQLFHGTVVEEAVEGVEDFGIFLE